MCLSATSDGGLGARKRTYSGLPVITIATKQRMNVGSSSKLEKMLDQK